MTTANLAEALPRLQKLREVTGDAVCVTLDVWLHKSRATDGVEWRVYLARDNKDFKAPTMERAIDLAEFFVGRPLYPLPTSGLPEVVLP